jgi:hypothetical protein
MARTNADEKPTCEEKPRSQKRDLSHPPRVCRLQFVFSTEDSWAEGLAFGPPKVMKNGSSSVTTLPGSTALPFVISTEAQRSGEISVWMLLLGDVFSTERSEVEGPAAFFAISNPQRNHAISYVSP